MSDKPQPPLSDAELIRLRAILEAQEYCGECESYVAGGLVECGTYNTEGGDVHYFSVCDTCFSINDFKRYSYGR